MLIKLQDIKIKFTCYVDPHVPAERMTDELIKFNKGYKTLLGKFANNKNIAILSNAIKAAVREDGTIKTSEEIASDVIFELSSFIAGTIARDFVLSIADDKENRYIWAFGFAVQSADIDICAEFPGEIVTNITFGEHCLDVARLSEIEFVIRFKVADFKLSERIMTFMPIYKYVDPDVFMMSSDEDADSGTD